MLFLPLVCASWVVYLIYSPKIKSTSGLKEPSEDAVRKFKRDDRGRWIALLSALVLNLGAIAIVIVLDKVWLKAIFAGGFLSLFSVFNWVFRLRSVRCDNYFFGSGAKAGNLVGCPYCGYGIHDR